MQLINDSIAIEQAAAQRDFRQKMSDVSIDAVQLLGDNFVTAAIKAGAGAKRMWTYADSGVPWRAPLLVAAASS